VKRRVVSHLSRVDRKPWFLNEHDKHVWIKFVSHPGCLRRHSLKIWEASTPHQCARENPSIRVSSHVKRRQEQVVDRMTLIIPQRLDGHSKRIIIIHTFVGLEEKVIIGL
jgi:hypothetical protein